MTSTRGLSETELLLRTMWEGGLDPVDRNGRPRVPLGSGPYSQLVRAVYPIAETRVPHVSRVLSNDECMRLYKGVAVANLGGLVLNTFLTISWGLANLWEPWRVRKAQADFQEGISSWFQYRRRRERDFPRYAGVWVKEVGRTLGLHTHYLLHVPPRHLPVFRNWVRATISKATESPRGLVRTTSTGRRLYVTDVRDLRSDIGAQWGVFRYMAKGLDPEELIKTMPGTTWRMPASEYIGLSETSEQGTVVGQRSGRSRAISEATFATWREAYDEVLRWAWRSAGPGSLEYGNAFLIKGQLMGLRI